MKCLEANRLEHSRWGASSSFQLACYNAAISACHFGTAWQAAMILSKLYGHVQCGFWHAWFCLSKSFFFSRHTHTYTHTKRRHIDMRFIHYLDFHFLLSHMDCLVIVYWPSQTGIALLQQLLDAGDVCRRLICACSVSCAKPESCQGPRPDRVTFCASIQVDSWVNKLIVSLRSTPL